MSEKNVYQLLKKHVIRHPDRIDRIENLTVVGMPDVNLCIEGRESWIEIKAPREPKRETTPLFGSNHKVSLEQTNWMKRQTDAGGRCFFFIGTNMRFLLLSGAIGAIINTMSVEELRKVALWEGMRRKADWKELRETL